MFISYAQNFEDVILWRALKNVKEGFYIDVGAQDPIADSISRSFNAQGWRGVHIEPSKRYAEALRKAYPSDSVIEALIGVHPGHGQYFEIANTGLSTADADLAERHAVLGRQIVPQTAIVIRLANVLDGFKDREIHWLKIDVEGHEASVIESWSPSTVRPWVVVVESVDPLTHEDNAQVWEPQLCALGYDLVYRDGLNRFYLSHNKMELKNAFAVGPNVFDGFSLSGTASSPFCAVQNQEREADQQRAASEIERLTSVHSAREAELAAQIVEFEADKQRAASEIERLTSAHSAREAELAAQIAELEDSKLVAMRDAERLKALHSVRESEFGTRIEALTAEKLHAETMIARLATQHSTRESELGAQIDMNMKEVARLHRVIFEQSSWGEASVRHVDQLTHEISALRNSTSWRLTSPIRGVGYVVKSGVTMIRRAPGGIVRRVARVVRSRAPQLYLKLATARSVRKIYTPFSRPAYAAPAAGPLLSDVPSPRHGDHASASPLTELHAASRALVPEAVDASERFEHHSAPVEAALLSALSKTPTSRRIHA